MVQINNMLSTFQADNREMSVLLVLFSRAGQKQTVLFLLHLIGRGK